MKIIELSLRGCQPLPDKKHSFKPGFNLIFGSNERGKSLTIDALTKLLLGKSSQHFPDIDRGIDDPAQYGSYVRLTVTENSQTQTVQLQGKKTLTDLTGLTADECQNLFLIRNSNLSIGRNLAEQDQFYTDVTDKLTGLKTQEIQQVKQQLRDMAQITDNTNQFRSRDKNLQLGERLEEAEQLLSKQGQLYQLLKQDKKHHWSDLETKMMELNKELDSTRQQLKQLTIARQHQQYQDLSGKLEQWQELDEQLKSFSQIRQQQLDDYRSAQQQLDRVKQDQQELKKEIEDKQQQLSDIKEQLDQVEQKLQQQTEPNQKLKHNIQPELTALSKKIARFEAVKIKPWVVGLIAGSSILLALILAYLFQPHTILILLIIIFSVSTIAGTVKYLLYMKQEQQLKQEKEELKLNLAQYNISGDQIEHILQQTYQFTQDYEQLARRQASLKAKAEQLQSDLDQLKQKLSSLKDKQQGQETIEKIQIKAQIKDLAELITKLQQKQDLLSKQQQLTAVINDKLGKPPSTTQALSYWQEQIKPPPSQDLDSVSEQGEYDAQQEQTLRQKQKNLQIKINQLQNKLSTFHNQLRDIQHEINHVLKDRSEPLLCQSATDLKQAQQELTNFIKHHQQQRQQALDLIEVLNQIEASEKQKVSQLFGQDSVIDDHFAGFTNNRYDQVKFNQDTSQIMVRLTKEKTWLTADKLSAGAYDQLYFAIRLGLGQKLLNDQPGFFILDDPFLKADQQRLTKQLQMLFKFAQQGWQILYFSAKNEIKDYVQSQPAHIITLES